MSAWPITLADVQAARARPRPHLPMTPLRSYAPLDEAVGARVRVVVKHENFQPTGAFKVRNAVAAPAALPAAMSNTQSPTTSISAGLTPRISAALCTSSGWGLGPEFTGLFEVMASDMWVVGGRTLIVTPATEIKAGLDIGVLAAVHAVQQPDSSLLAREIEPARRDDSNQNGNVNSNDSDDDHLNGNVNSNVNSNADNGDDEANGNLNANEDNDNGHLNGNVNSNEDNSNDEDNSNLNSNEDNDNDAPDGGSNDNSQHD